MTAAGGIEVQVRIGTRGRDPESFPREDDALGERLAELVRTTLLRGVPPPAVVVLRAERVDLVDLRGILDAHLSVHRFIAAAAGQDDVEAVALLAVVDQREAGKPVGHTGMVFVEWPDNRWWHGYHLLSQAFKPLDDMPMVLRRAVDGLPRPDGLGGWFSRARFERLKLRLREVAPPPDAMIM
ncbi:MAG: hypothetical protein ABIO70_27790 [Pseudomonadota bacterium]